MALKDTVSLKLVRISLTDGETTEIFCVNFDPTRVMLVRVANMPHTYRERRTVVPVELSPTTLTIENKKSCLLSRLASTTDRLLIQVSIQAWVYLDLENPAFTASITVDTQYKCGAPLPSSEAEALARTIGHNPLSRVISGEFSTEKE